MKKIARLQALKVAGGYTMVAILPNGKKEYPQENKIHKTENSIWEDAKAMYGRQPTWEYNGNKKTITI